MPLPVIGDHTFAALSADHTHTCGITDTAELMCWGSNTYGELGMSAGGGSPRRMAASHAFRLVGTAIEHTCAVTLDDVTLCWGRNEHYQLGTEDVDASCRFGAGWVGCSDMAQEVTTAIRFTTLDTNTVVTCGLADGGRAYCWGANGSGQLGDGSGRDRASPTPVAGDRSFTLVTVGFKHVCALVAEGDAFCWGRDAGTFGAGRDGPVIPAPAMAAPGLRFTKLSAGFEHTCGVTTSGVTYCWGRNWQGQLGNGRSGLDQRETTPVRVVAGG